MNYIEELISIRDTEEEQKKWNTSSGTRRAKDAVYCLLKEHRLLLEGERFKLYVEKEKRIMIPKKHLNDWELNDLKELTVRIEVLTVQIDLLKEYGDLYLTTK